jgi:stage IV sporulation protein B
VIGLEIRDERVTVDGFDPTLGTAAKEAGLQIGDQILSIDETPVHCTGDVRQALSSSEGQVTIQALRDNRQITLTVQPAITENGPKLGITLRQGISGIGTVTYYDPDSGSFGALGHAINQKDGKLVSMAAGFAYPAAVERVVKGKSGNPGQLTGAVTAQKPFATLAKNTPQGIFGSAAKVFSGDPLPAAEVSQIRTGPAKIRSTVMDTDVQEYSVEILKIYPDSGSDGRNMLLKVTDQRLLDTTGGIVQGMSGSPIIQDGKLVGAVTHVLVNDPTTGYGIFIENMLDAAA